MKSYFLNIGLAAVMFALSVVSLTPDSRPAVPPGHEVAGCGVLRVITGANRRERRQERRANGAGFARLFGGC